MLGDFGSVLGDFGSVLDNFCDVYFLAELLLHLMNVGFQLEFFVIYISYVDCYGDLQCLLHLLRISRWGGLVSALCCLRDILKNQW
jgi:hypothetical protein